MARTEEAARTSEAKAATIFIWREFRVGWWSSSLPLTATITITSHRRRHRHRPPTRLPPQQPPSHAIRQRLHHLRRPPSRCIDRTRIAYHRPRRKECRYWHQVSRGQDRHHLARSRRCRRTAEEFQPGLLQLGIKCVKHRRAPSRHGRQRPHRTKCPAQQRQDLQRISKRLSRRRSRQALCMGNKEGQKRKGHIQLLLGPRHHKGHGLLQLRQVNVRRGPMMQDADGHVICSPSYAWRRNV